MNRRCAISESRGIFYAIMVLLAFLLLLALALGGVYLFHANRDFYSALRGQLDRRFYLSAALLLIFSTVLYTPFSYGISHYFLLSAKGEGRFGAVFFLFRRPLLLTKATAISIIKKVLVYFERILLLLAGALVEVALFFSFLVVTGEDIFSVQENPFRLAAEFMLRSPWLIGLSIALWSGVLLGFLVIHLRYILCKYMLLKYPDVGIFQAIRVGRSAIRSHLIKTMLFYLRYGAFCVLAVLTFGLSVKMASSWGHRSFSVYADELAEQGWRDYCRRRSLRQIKNPPS